MHTFDDLIAGLDVEYLKTFVGVAVLVTNDDFL